MVATMLVKTDYGGSDGTPGTAAETVTNLRFKTADNNTQDSNNPITIPGAGTTYSYWKHVYLFCSVAPSTQIDNVRLYTDGGGFGTGITLYAGNQFPVRGSGPVYTGYEVADTTSTMVSNHTGISSQSDLFGFTSGSPFPTASYITISESGNIISAQNETTNYVVLQLAVASTASPGSLTPETLTFVYDEI